MQKISSQAKHIVLFILLLTVVPLGFVNGFFAYLKSQGTPENIELFYSDSSQYFKLCLNAAIISFICVYPLYFSKSMAKLKIWLKILLSVLLYLVLFFIWQFIFIFVLNNIFYISNGG